MSNRERRSLLSSRFFLSCSRWSRSTGDEDLRLRPEPMGRKSWTLRARARGKINVRTWRHKNDQTLLLCIRIVCRRPPRWGILWVACRFTITALTFIFLGRWCCQFHYGQWGYSIQVFDWWKVQGLSKRCALGYAFLLPFFLEQITTSRFSRNVKPLLSRLRSDCVYV